MKQISSLILALILGIAFTFTTWIDKVQSGTPAYRTYVDASGELLLQVT